jgi:translation elongation factor EF-1beta
MARVAVVFKVYPKEGALDSVVKELKEKLKPQGMQTEDIAFGIKLIKVLFTFDDTQTSSSKIEESIKALPGVSEVEVHEETLV